MSLILLPLALWFYFRFGRTRLGYVRAWGVVAFANVIAEMWFYFSVQWRRNQCGR